MREENQSPNPNPQRSPDSSGDQQKEEGKKHGSILNKLIFAVCVATIGFVGLNFLACNFMLPGSINAANLNGNLKNPPPLDCKESEKKGYETLLTILTTVIALRTKVD